MAHYAIHHLQWAGLDIEVRICADWSALTAPSTATLSPTCKSMRLVRPCPADTGYLSVFDTASQIEAEGGPLAYVRDWLERAAALPEWLTEQAKWQQLSCFELRCFT